MLAPREDLDDARRQVAHGERLAALGSLVSGLAHEIRTPLASAMNHVELLRSRIARVQAGESPTTALADAPGHAAATLDALERINRLVEGLRRFTRLEEGKREALSLDAPAGEAVRIFQSAHRGVLDVRAQLRPTTPVPLDKVQLEQVVLRLLENAADAMPGGKLGVVHVATRESPMAVELVVEDNGVGMPPDVLAHVFDEFYTTKPGRAGLGLSIARRIVEAHGGAIALRSKPGNGTTFVVSLPKAARSDITRS